MPALLSFYRAICFCLIGGLILAMGLPTSARAEAPAPRAEAPLSPEIPFLSDWLGSPHADWKSEAFVHWDKNGAVPKACAKCHSGTGFLDFLGADGSAPGTVDHAAPTGTVITCVACHNKAAMELSKVTFPSGLTVRRQGKSARCMQCHQGRQSGMNVTDISQGLSDDAVTGTLKFLNVHYRAAGATLMGSLAAGAYEYPVKKYAGPLQHQDNVNACVACHDPHRTEVKVALCSDCHKGVISRKDLVTIRGKNNKTDFDGDGNAFEGVAGEVSTLHGALYAMIQDYAKTVLKKPIGYDAHAYPYFFNDTDANGVIDKAEASFKNQYAFWSPRLLRTAYNYQFIAKDPGAYAHNPVYALQILHDSVADLAKKVPSRADGMVRAQ